MVRTLPLTSSPLIVPLNSSVIGIGSVIETFQDIASPLTVPPKISVEFPSAIWLPLSTLLSVFTERVA